MCWIEQVFGMLPAGGSGIVELLLVLTPAAVFVLGAIVRWRRARMVRESI